MIEGKTLYSEGFNNTPSRHRRSISGLEPTGLANFLWLFLLRCSEGEKKMEKSCLSATPWVQICSHSPGGFSLRAAQAEVKNGSGSGPGRVSELLCEANRMRNRLRQDHQVRLDLS